MTFLLEAWIAARQAAAPRRPARSGGVYKQSENSRRDWSRGSHERPPAHRAEKPTARAASTSPDVMIDQPLSAASE